MAILQTPWYDKAVEALKLNGSGSQSLPLYNSAGLIEQWIEFDP